MTIEYPNYIRSNNDFVSVKSGNWNDPTTWKIRDNNNNLQYTKYYPESNNNVWVESGHTVTCTQNEACKTLNVNVTQDVVRINTGVFKLSLWGTLKSYDGTYSSNSFNSSNAGVGGFISGILSFTGTASRTIMGPGQTVTANIRSGGWTMEIDFPSGMIATHDNAVSRCGYLVVKSGTLNVLTANSTSNEIRISGIDYTAQPGDGINTGTVTVKSGATFIPNGRLIKNTPTSAANGIGNLIVETGGIFVPTLAASTTPTLAYSLLGEVWFTQLYSQNFLDKGSNVDSIDITTYSTVKIGGSGSKTLRTNTTINSKLSFAESGATLVLGGFTLSYGTLADLEYTTNRTKGTELINSGSGSAIPRNLILGTGVVLDLGGATVNIRGTLTLGAGASITNGTLNQNQP
jgi:hypothetical protein